MILNMDLLQSSLTEILGDPDVKKIVGRTLIKIPVERRESAMFQLVQASGLHKNFFLGCIDELRKK
jgi:hypothetical protein